MENNIEEITAMAGSDNGSQFEKWDNIGNEVPFPGDVRNGSNSEPVVQETANEDASNAGERWEDFPDAHEGLDDRPDIDGVPQTMWRGERYYLDNIDELGHRDLSTKGHETTHNRDGKVYTARDKKYASLYAVGTDGVTFYDEPLPVEQIPIGVVFKINNSENHLKAIPTAENPDTWGPFEGKFREFISEEIPAEDCEVVEIYIMDDFVANDVRVSKHGEGFDRYKTGGHVRSDFRRPMEVYRLKDQSELPGIIEKVKKRMAELDAERRK